jgi:hypothetical protein
LADDAKLASVSITARYTFVLLISKSDDDGLVPGAHRQLLGLLYPHNEDVTVAYLLEWLEELATIGVVRWRVTRDRVPVVELVNWSKHQRIDNKGRNTLRGLLLDEHDAAVTDSGSRNLAESRGDLRRLAEPRRSEVDRERDRKEEGERGNRSPLAGQSTGGPSRRVTAPTPAWVTRLRDHWLAKVGAIAPSSIAKLLGAAFTIHGEECLLKAIDAYADAKLAAGKDRKLEWFAADIEQWVARIPTEEAPIIADGWLSEIGERVTRPAGVSP